VALLLLSLCSAFVIIALAIGLIVDSVLDRDFKRRKIQEEYNREKQLQEQLEILALIDSSELGEIGEREFDDPRIEIPDHLDSPYRSCPKK